MSTVISPTHFSIYSVGIVAANKHLDTDIAYIHPIEVTIFGDGELDANIEEFEGVGINKEGLDYNVKVKHDSAIEAKWLALGNTNRLTAPDLRRGERVLLWRHGDSDQFWWSSMGIDDHLRKLETVIYSWSGTTDENADSTSPENCYYFEVCTHQKLVTFKTSKANEEPYAYTFQFDTGDGKITLADDIGNYFEIDSSRNRLVQQNAAGTYISLDQKYIGMWAEESVFLYGANGIELRSDGYLSVFTGQDCSFSAGGKGTFNAAGGMNLFSNSELTMSSYGPMNITGQEDLFIGSSGTFSLNGSGNLEISVMGDFDTTVGGTQLENVTLDKRTNVGNELTVKVGRDLTYQVARIYRNFVFGDMETTVKGWKRSDITGTLNYVIGGNSEISVAGWSQELIGGQKYLKVDEKFELTSGQVTSIIAPRVQVTSEENIFESPTTTFTGKVIANGLVTEGELELTGDIKTTGNISSEGKITADGGIQTNGDVISTGNVDIEGNIISHGNIASMGNLTVNGNSIMGGSVAIMGDFSVGGGISATGNMSITGDLTVGGTIVQAP